MDSSEVLWPQLSDLTGTNACVSLSTNFISLLLAFSLLISHFYRNRHTIFLAYYKNRKPFTSSSNTPTSPYEVIALLLISIPRLIWLARFAFENVINGSFTLVYTTDIWSYVFFVYMLGTDMWSRRSFQRDTWKKYWERKERLQSEITISSFPAEKEKDGSELLIESDSMDTTPEITSMTTSEPTKPRTLSDRLKSMFTTPTIPEPTANDVLSRIHFAALIDALMLWNFLLAVSSAVCGAGPPGLMKEQSLVVGLMALVPYFCFRSVALLLQGRRFARTEMEWEMALCRVMLDIARAP